MVNDKVYEQHSLSEADKRRAVDGHCLDENFRWRNPFWEDQVRTIGPERATMKGSHRGSLTATVTALLSIKHFCYLESQRVLSTMKLRFSFTATSLHGSELRID